MATAGINPNMLMQEIMQRMLQMQPNSPLAPPPNAMPQVTPETLKRERIAKALAAAGSSMATTPGNFMTGLSAGAGAGAGAFHDTKDTQRQQSREAMKDYEGQQRQRMQMMQSLLGGAGTMASGKRADAAAGRAGRAEQRSIENTEYERKRQEKLDKKAIKDELRANLRTQASDISARESAKFKSNIEIEKLLNSRAKALGLDNEYLSEEERISRMAELNAYEKRLRSGGKTAKKTKRTPQIGDTATNAAGEKLRLTAQGWVPIQ